MNPETKSLVDAIVQGLVAALGQKKQAPGPVALVHTSPRDEKIVNELRARLGQDLVVHFQGEIADLEPDFHVIPELSCSDMVDLAQGKGSSIAMRNVLDLLLHGKSVRTLGFAFRAHAHTAPQALLRLYESHVATLSSYGLTEMDGARADNCQVRRMLITARDVQDFPATARELCVPHGAIVTQLAQDEAAARGLTIIKTL